MHSVKISIAIPTYSRPKLLLDLIMSVPSYVPISISDNDSSLSGMTASLGKNVKINHADRLLPVFANWNRAVSFIPSDTTHVMIPSDDDLYLPNAFESINKAIDKYPSADMIVFGCDIIDENGSKRASWVPDKEELCQPGDGFLKFETVVHARMPSVLFRTEFYQRIGGFNERFELTASDSELIQRATLLGKTAFVPSVISQYRVWNGSLTYARQATEQWLNEVELWTNLIAQLLRSGHQPPSRRVDIERYRNEIYARNLLAGLNNLHKKGEHKNARNFLARHPIPKHISLPTRLRLMRMRWNLWRASN